MTLMSFTDFIHRMVAQVGSPFRIEWVSGDGTDAYRLNGTVLEDGTFQYLNGVICSASYLRAEGMYDGIVSVRTRRTLTGRVLEIKSVFYPHD